jgi:EmrB/QacA subfamily drug resistance transporter
MPSKHKTITLVLLALTQLIVIVDSSIVNIALPAIKEALHFSNDSLQWVITAYILFFGGSLMLGGRFSDRLGRRKLLIVGVAGFTFASLLLGLSRSSGVLILLRCIQGVSAAIMTAAALSILLTTFREGHERHKALSVWGFVGAAGGAIGVIMGGVLTQHLGWRWIFFVNVPVGVLVLIGVLLYIEEDTPKTDNQKLDLPGAALITGGVMSIVYALSRAPQIGWKTPTTVASFLTGILLFTGFYLNEKRTTHPIIPFSIFRMRSVSGGNIVMMLVTAVGMGQFFFNALYLQNILHYSPSTAGAAFLPIPIGIAVTIIFVPRLLNRVGFKRLLLIGVILTGIGAYLLALLTTHSSYLMDIVPAFLLLGMGLGMALVSTNVAATSGVADNKSGLASGLINTSQQIGGALGIAALTVVATMDTKVSGMITMQGYHRVYVGIVILVALSVLVTLFVLQVPQSIDSKTEPED